MCTNLFSMSRIQKLRDSFDQWYFEILYIVKVLTALRTVGCTGVVFCS